MALSRRKVGVLMALGLLAIAAISAYKIQGMLQRGETIFWLAELWAPAAFLSIGLVTCVEFLTSPVPASQPQRPPARGRSGARKGR